MSRESAATKHTRVSREALAERGSKKESVFRHQQIDSLLHDDSPLFVESRYVFGVVLFHRFAQRVEPQNVKMGRDVDATTTVTLGQTL